MKLDNIFSEYKGIPLKKEEYILSCYRKYVARIQKLVGIEIKENTYQKFVYVGNHLEAFIKWKFKKSDFPLKELSLRFLDDFDYYLKTQKSIKQITINKIIQRLRTSIKQAISEGYLDRDPFYYINLKSSTKRLFFLPQKNSKLLKNLHLLQKD